MVKLVVVGKQWRFCLLSDSILLFLSKVGSFSVCAPMFVMVVMSC